MDIDETNAEIYKYKNDKYVDHNNKEYCLKRLYDTLNLPEL